jgi:preprotein translocase subunit SecE
MFELIKELFRFHRYKASQGRLIRRLTMSGVWVLFATAAWKCTLMDFTWIARWCTWFAGWNTQLEAARQANALETIDAVNAQIQAFTSSFIAIFPFAMAGLILLFGMWFGYRLVQWVLFADFLISVEGEMAKVSWPSRSELHMATIVVLTVFFILSGVLYTYDLIFVALFKFMGVV